MEKKNTRTYYFNGKPKLISWRVILLTVLVLVLCAGGVVFGIRTEADMINSSAAEASSRLLQKSREVRQRSGSFHISQEVHGEQGLRR